MASCATVALMLGAVAVLRPDPVMAQILTLPATSTGVVLDSYPGYTQFLVTNGTTISEPDRGISGGAGTRWTLSNQGTITGGSQVGVSFTDGGVVTNGDTANTAARIEGGNDGVYANGDQTVTNFGTITGNSRGVLLNAGGSVANTGVASLISGNDGVYIQHGPGTVTNDGTIIGLSGYGVRIVYGSAGASLVTNTATGVISGATDGIDFFDAPATVNNSGQISGGTGYGVSLDTGQLINNAGGTISGDSGVQIAYGAVNNSGIITATGSGTAGVRVNRNAAVTNTASGAISGELGVWMTDGGTVTNAGVITGTGFFGIEFDNDGLVTNGGATNTTARIEGLLDGVNAVGDQTVINFGTITGNSHGVVLNAGGGVANTGAASLISGGDGVYIQHGVGTVTNDGTIIGLGFYGVGIVYGSAGASLVTNTATGVISGGVHGVGFYDAPATVNNSGQISGGTGYGVSLGTGQLINNAGGTISGDSGVQISRGELNNSGIITATGIGTAGVRDNGDATVTNTASGTISGELGVWMTYGGTVTNAGVITGTGSSGIGVKFEDGSAGTLDNSGSIAGAGGTAVSFGDADDLLVLHPTASFTGAVLGGGGVDTLELAGDTLTNAGTLTGVFTGFGVVKVDAGANWTFTSDRTFGADVAVTNAGMLTNQGTIANTVTLAGVGVLNNSGLVSSATDGVVGLSGGGPNTLVNSGIITTTGTIGTGVKFTTGKVTNNSDGQIQGARDGVAVSGLGTVVNTGTITGVANAGVVLHAGGGLTNSGLITGAAAGVVVEGGVSLITNTGTIAGSATTGVGVLFTGGSGTIDNFGTISGAGGSAVKFAGGVNQLILEDGSKLIGLADGSLGVNTLVVHDQAGLSGVNITGFQYVAFVGPANPSTGGPGQTIDAGSTITNPSVIAGTLVNQGALKGVVSVSAGATLDSSGAVSVDAASINAGDIANTGSITNLSTLTNIGSLANAGAFANSGTVINSGQFTNTGSLVITGAGVFTNTGGFTNSGTVTGAVNGVSGGGVITNSGTILGVADTGVNLGAGGVLNNTGAGFIQGGAYGVQVGAGGTVTNAGVILDDDVAGLALGDNGVLTNSGTLGGVIGLKFTGAGAEAVNSGVITGTGGVAVQFGPGVNHLTLTTGSVLNGGIDGGGGDSRITLTGTGALSSPITNFGSGGSLAIASGAVWTASGAWSIGSVTNSGVLRLGSTTGVLRLTGNFTQAADGTLQVAVNAVGQSSQLLVTGAATLNGALSVVAANGAYQPSTTYLILTSTALSGKFASISTDLAFLTPTVRYDAQNAYLMLAVPVAEPVAFSSVAVTPNQHNTAEAAQAGGETSALYKAVLGQSASGARTAFNALSGEIYASTKGALADDGRVVSQSMLGRLWRSQVGGTDDADSRVTSWGEVVGGWGRTNGDRDNNAASVEQDRSGFMTGMDARIGQAWRIGVAGGYNNADLKIVDRGSEAKIGAYNLGLYAGGALGALNVRVGAAHAWSDVDVARSVLFPGFQDAVRSSYDANTDQAFGEVGYRFTWRAAAFEPFAGLSYIDLRTDAANEHGGAASLNIADSSANNTYATLGLRTAGRWTLDSGVMVEPRMTIAWRHAYGDLTPEADVGFAGAGTDFSVTGVALARDAALMELGVDLTHGDRLKLGVTYRGALSKTVQDNALAAVLSWSF